MALKDAVIVGGLDMQVSRLWSLMSKSRSSAI